MIPAGVAASLVTTDGKAKYTGMHALTHFYALWCINRTKDGGLGLPSKNVQERRGHASITITLDRYGHVFKGDDPGELMRRRKPCWAKTERSAMGGAISHD